MRRHIVSFATLGSALRADLSAGVRGAIASMFGAPEEDLEEVNEVDARGYAVMGERSFLGLSGGAIGSPSVLSPVAIQSQKMADLNKT